MMNNFAAQLSATLHVFGQRMEARSERGQTTAEYVGIVAFVAILVIALFSLDTPIKAKVLEIITAAFDKIKTSMP